MQVNFFINSTHCFSLCTIQWKAIQSTSATSKHWHDSSFSGIVMILSEVHCLLWSRPQDGAEPNWKRLNGGAHTTSQPYPTNSIKISSKICKNARKRGQRKILFLSDDRNIYPKCLSLKPPQSHRAYAERLTRTRTQVQSQSSTQAS